MEISSLRIPTATYRLQFNHYFTFNHAYQIIDYLYELGISDYYASPIMRARPGSLHGYDTLDHNQINPEIGTEESLEQLATGLAQKGMGFLLDIVPNHMCIVGTNKWWNDVLENGPSSLYAKYFDIVWNSPKVKLKNKILLSVLDRHYGNVIENKEIKVVYEGGAFFIEFKEGRFPVNPRTWRLILEPASKEAALKLSAEDPYLLEFESILTALSHLPSITETDPEKCRERNREKEIIKKRLALLLEESPISFQVVQNSLATLNGYSGDLYSFDLLEELLESQAYRLSYWRVTNDEINYRRFFDINELASIRAEDEEVFASIHELYLQLVKRKWVTGFRIDHVDGLFDPQQYFQRLQKACVEALKDEKLSDQEERPFYVIVEKILEGHEQLPLQWNVWGTTGYDYLNLLNGLFISVNSERILRKFYEGFTEQRETMAQIVYTCKKLILLVSMSSELYILARHLEDVAEQHRLSRDYTLESLGSALRDMIACFPVYRSYIRLNDQEVSAEDKKYIKGAIQQAKKLNPASDPSIFDFIESVLLLQDPIGLNEKQIAYRRNFIMRFQQLTGPVMAKGLEDTTFYRYYPLVSLNEVGMDPYSFGTSIQTFHHKNQQRLAQWPHTLLTTFTHDTKRSEDVRARINALSEKPEEWIKAVERWRAYNQDKKTDLDQSEVPSLNEEYLLYQTLVGSWPLYSMDASARAQYIDRIDKYMNKALREAKIHTSWINPSESYEKAMQDFIHKILTLDSANYFLKDLMEFVQPVMRAGLFNSLSQTILKITSPGIPDFYQGSELWEFTLVDPDNRHPIDYSYRYQLLKDLKEKAKQNKSELVTHLLETPEDGRIKLYITSELLNFRRTYGKLFQEGTYIPLKIEGEKQDHICAFARLHEDQCIIVATGRFFTHFTSPLPIGEQVWHGTALSPQSSLKGRYQDLFSGAQIDIESEQALDVALIFSKLPLTILYRISTE